MTSEAQARRAIHPASWVVLVATAVAVPIAARFVAVEGASHEHRMTTYALWGAVVGLGVALWGAFAPGVSRQLREARGRRFAFDTAAVLGLSLLVRFGLTEPNILTDGGTGYARVMSFRRGFGGFSVLVDQVLGDVGEWALWQAIPIAWGLAALFPPAVYALGRALRLGRPVSVLAGVMMAAWPMHAALFSSDFLMGPLISLATIGLALLTWGLNGRPAAAFAGTTLLAYTVWFRPEAVIVGLPVALIATPRIRYILRHPGVAAGFGWLLTQALASISSTRFVGSAADPGLADKMRVWDALSGALVEPALAPPWLWIPFVIGLPVALWPRRRERAAGVVITISAVGSAVPLLWSKAFMDPLGTYIEVFRYGAWTYPWLALAAATGLYALLSLAPAGRPRRVALSLGAAAIALTPFVYLDYLGRVYVARAEEQVIEAMLTDLPDGCGLIVPDEDMTYGTYEHRRRYLAIAAASRLRGESDLTPERVLGLVGALERVAADGDLPHITGAPRDNARCWYYFRGSYCDHAVDDEPSVACARADEVLVLEETARATIPYLHHRLVTVPHPRENVHHQAEQPLVMYRVVGVR